MTDKRIDDAAQALKSTPAEIEAKTVRPDATGTLLEKQQAAGEAHRAKQAGTTGAPVVERKAPKRRTLSVRASTRNHSEIKAWLIRDMLHRESVGAATYSLEGYRGLVEKLPGIVERYVLHRVDLSRSEQRFRELLAAHRQFPIDAPSEITQQRSKSGRVTVAPQMRRPIGASDFQEVVATSILLRSLSAVTNKDSMLAVKAEVVRKEIALTSALETWNPEKRLERPGARPGDDPRTVVVSDENGEQIFAVRVELAKAIEVARQRALLKEYLKTLKAEHAWLWTLLREVDQAAEAALSAQLKKDRVSQAQFCRGMLAGGYESDFAGMSYQTQLDELENKK